MRQAVEDREPSSCDGYCGLDPRTLPVRLMIFNSFWA